MPGEGAVRNASAKRPAWGARAARNSAHSALDRRRVLVGDRPDRRGQEAGVAHRLLGGALRQELGLELGVGVHVGPSGAHALAAEAGQTVAEIQGEGFPLLFPVVDDVEPGVELQWDDARERLPPGRGDRGLVHGLAAHPAGVEPGQRRGPGQAARVRGQDPPFAAPHSDVLPFPSGRGYRPPAALARDGERRSRGRRGSAFYIFRRTGFPAATLEAHRAGDPAPGIGESKDAQHYPPHRARPRGGSAPGGRAAPGRRRSSPAQAPFLRGRCASSSPSRRARPATPSRG